MKVPITVLAVAIAIVCGHTDDDGVGNVLKEIHRLEEIGLDFTVETLITANGYPVETHHITTTDGYILTLHRIPNGLKGKNLGRVAFLQHGILASAADWCIAGADHALAFLLADQGYDVWLGNSRGNTWCKSHVNLTTSDAAFWQYSFHEIGTIDLPQMIDYVLQKTGVSGVYYVGHSQGTTVYYTMLSMLPEYNSKIIAGVNMAPIAFMSHMTSPLLRIVSSWIGAAEIMAKMIGINEFFPNDDFMKYVIGETLCKEDSITQLLCTNSLFAICGFSRSQMNTTLLPIMTKYTPAGASTKQFLHFGQEINSGYFRQYDHGLIGNMATYKQMTPPSYDLAKVNATTYLIYSKNDWLSAEKDVEKLYKNLGSSRKGKILMSDFHFNHLDYMFGIDAKVLVYNKVISLFARN